MKTQVQAILLGLASVLSGCGGGGGSAPAVAGDPCSETAKKQFVLDSARDRYLFLDLLPASVDTSQYSTASVLMDALAATARAQNKDRFFSYITTITAEQQLLAGGTSVGFGVSLSQRAAATRLFIAQVFEASAAADAGFLRGDEILAIGASDTTLENVSAILARTNGLTDALGPSTAGIARTFRILTPAGVTVLRTVTKREFSINPVPSTLVRVIPRLGNTPVGYLFFRSFISPADDALRNAFVTFRNQGVRDVIIDLRYNGGGLVATAEILMNLLAGGTANQVMYRTRLNRNYTASQQTVRFATPALAQSIAPLKIAFIATESSASASELTINTLAPYVQVAIVGARTFGKPVGQTAHDIASCDFRLRLISFGDENRDGYGDYFSGLPPQPPDLNYTDDFCPIVDDLSKPLGDANENLYAEALGWINQNRCGTAILFAPQQKASAGVLADNGTAPVPLHPEPFQVYMPGSF
jgi:C-terminal processing protease CtpA/Prc